MPQDTTQPVATGAVLHQVRAHFHDSDRLQAAVTQLGMAGFDRADMSLPNHPADGEATPETAARPVNTEEDARQQRALHAGMAASAAGMAAAGVVVATGGAALPALAAAVAAGGAAGGGMAAITSAVTGSEQTTRDADAGRGMLELAVRAPTPEKRDHAEKILRDAGGEHVERF
ncbi:MAG: hypothetical protein J0H67_21080 [Rhodospirillales bacterium]|nr:hypothetical protein [Rhodospirillales bacterium]